MKKLFYFVCTGIVVFISCTKSDIKPADTSISSVKEDQASVKARSALLTAHPWKYEGLYFHYVDDTNKGDAEYERGGANNLLDLDKTRFFFKADGTFVEFDGGYRYPGKWHFTDNSATVLFLDFQYWTDDCTIVMFTNNHLSYTEPLGYGDKSFTELIPAQ